MMTELLYIFGIHPGGAGVLLPVAGTGGGCINSGRYLVVSAVHEKEHDPAF